MGLSFTSCVCVSVCVHTYGLNNYAYPGWSEEDVQCLTLSFDGYFPGDRTS